MNAITQLDVLDLEHTIARYETAFYEPMVSDWRNFESWYDAGAETAEQRAHSLWKQLLKEYQQPELDPAVEEALVSYVAQRKQAIAQSN